MSMQTWPDTVLKPGVEVLLSCSFLMVSSLWWWYNKVGGTYFLPRKQNFTSSLVCIFSLIFSQEYYWFNQTLVSSSPVLLYIKEFKMTILNRNYTYSYFCIIRYLHAYKINNWKAPPYKILSISRSELHQHRKNKQLLCKSILLDIFDWVFNKFAFNLANFLCKGINFWLVVAAKNLS